MQYRIQNTDLENNCSKTLVHKIINVPVFYMVVGLNDFDGGKYLLWPLEGVGPENFDFLSFLSPNGPLSSLLFQVLGGGGEQRGQSQSQPIARAIGRGFEKRHFFEPNDILFACCQFRAQKGSAIIPLQLSFYYHLALFVNNLRRLVNVNNQTKSIKKLEKCVIYLFFSGFIESLKSSRH